MNLTTPTVDYLLALAKRYTALVWITWDRKGDCQPLLMPWPVAFGRTN